MTKKQYDYLAVSMFIILMVGMIGYQLVKAWFIVPIFMVLIFTNYKRLQLLEKAKAKSALITLVGLLSILGLFIIYSLFGILHFSNP